MVDDVGNAEKQVLSEFLQRKMSDRGWNQAEVARVSGLSKTNISMYVNGLALPNPSSFESLAEAFGYPSAVDMRMEMLGAQDALERPGDFEIARRVLRRADPSELITLLDDLSSRVSTLLAELSAIRDDRSPRNTEAKKRTRKE